MRVLLIDPPQEFLRCRGQARCVQPLGLGYVGAYLEKHGHEVRFLLPDTRSYIGDDPWGELRAAVLAEAPDVVGMTAVTASYPAARRMATEIKALLPQTTVVLGGTHASSNPVRSLLDAPDVDFVVAGEGEETMRELLEVLALGRGVEAPDKIAGLVWRDEDGKGRYSGPRESISDLDALPFPKRDGLVWDEGIHPVFYQAMITLRGCPYRCIYCAVPSSNDRRTRYRSATDVVDEIEYLRTTYDIPYLFFHDSVFTLHRGRTVEICQQMIARGQQVPFACQTRADRIDGELLDLMKEAGCHQIFFGIESGDAVSLKKIRKKMSLEKIRSAVAEVKARQMRCTGFFMVGFPWEDEALIRRTADFACSLDLDAVSLFSATPLPGTELWDMAGGDHMPENIDFRTPQVNLTSMSPEAYRAVYDDVSAQLKAYNRGRIGVVSW